MRDQLREAQKLFDSGQFEQASSVINSFSDMEISEPEFLIKLGELAFKLGDDVHAINFLSKAVKLQPENAYCHYFLAKIYFQQGKKEQAFNLCCRAVEIDPNQSQSFVILGKILSGANDFTQAVELLARAISLSPDNAEACQEIVSGLLVLGRHNEALEYAEKLLEIDDSADNYIPISRVLIELGRMDEAATYLERALKMDNRCGVAYFKLASIKKITLEDDEIVKKAENALLKDLLVDQKSLIHFSLGKMYDDLKEWDIAFEHYRQGNLLGRAAVEPTGLYSIFDQAKKIYGKKRLFQSDAYGSDSDVPVFIVGMPRSGSTLTEQIISSHPDVSGSGELAEVLKIHAEICLSGDLSVASMDEKLSKEKLSGYASNYLKILRRGRESSIRVIDKSLGNYASLGLVNLLFPNARIVHISRNPLDVCLSCYFQPFVHAQESYDLDWLVRRYRFYKKSVLYWKNLLPEGVILDVKYEDLIGDFEAQSRRLIEFCGLPWDDGCLEFYSNKRAISTASVWQARQPIYTSSRKRWHNYAPYIKELANGLSDYLDDEDIAELAERGIKVKKKWVSGFFK